VSTARLVALATAVPPHAVRQDEARRFAARIFSAAIREDPRLIEVFENAQIDRRYACASLDWLASGPSFAQRNDLYIESAVRLGSEVARLALARARLSARDVDHIVFVSSTGIATPSIDALVANELDFRPDARRTPIWGLGCAGGAVGLSRARDFALADPGARVLVIALELCSLAFLPDDVSKRNLVAASLFGDGAAAALVVGEDVVGVGHAEHHPLSLLASRSVLWKDTRDVMGWTLDDAGLRVVFSRDIPAIVFEKARPELVAFLAARGLDLGDIRHVVAHPGGIKVLRAYAEALELAPHALDHARSVLRDYGNMSSPSCLFVLERFLAAGDIAAGDYALVMALGPGFAAEYVLARGGEE
jgi:alkylresorcinol/alkylpyrone synthase